ncbi:hypothetical protein [Agrobacterium tumefaciens]|uniref:hypothetical protein n=1 Tax=Agrobacterium tumefaciens TaxID=358 RepID=UPI001573D286|nr:hypothetical protein [Agrobacterium tumefaciens]NTB05942.1 hypothetical protein [Agrobacterium tumefaciens]
MRFSSNNQPSGFQWISPAIAGLLIGVLSWSGNLLGLLLTPLLVLVWSRSSSRSAAFAAAFCYYLGAGRGLLRGAGVFFSDLGPAESFCYGMILWLGYSGVLGLVWGLLWGRTRLPLRLLAILAIISLPPVGVIGGFNPLLSAAAYFPGLEWTGLVLGIVGLALLAECRCRLPAALPLAAAAVFANLHYAEPSLPGWAKHDTAFGKSDAVDGDYERMMKLQRVVEDWSETRSGTVLLLPELVGGDWPVNENWWQGVARTLKDRGQTVIIGAYLPVGDGTAYDNVLVSIGNDAGKQFRDRVPVPISMWKPWSTSGARTYWGEHEVHELNGKRVASLICYEQLLMWPALLSLARSPDLVLAPANDWWARETNLPGAQHQSVRAWSRLFAIPSLWTTNM